MTENKSTSFTDAAGFAWRCRFTTPDLIDGCRAVDLTLEDLQDPMGVNFGKVVELVWYACRRMASDAGTTKKDFYENRLTPAFIMLAVKATFNALAEAFPQPEETEAEKTGPLAPAPTPAWSLGN